MSTERREFLLRFFEKILYTAWAVFLCGPVFFFISFKKSLNRKVTFKKGKGLAGIVYKEGVFLVQSGGSHRALSARCTHLGCTLNYDPVSLKFLCPCHGSQFDISGKRIAGPAKRDLQVLPIEKKGKGDLVVTLKL